MLNNNKLKTCMLLALIGCSFDAASPRSRRGRGHGHSESQSPARDMSASPQAAAATPNDVVVQNLEIPLNWLRDYNLTRNEYGDNMFDQGCKFDRSGGLIDFCFQRIEDSVEVHKNVITMRVIFEFIKVAQNLNQNDKDRLLNDLKNCFDNLYDQWGVQGMAMASGAFRIEQSTQNTNAVENVIAQIEINAGIRKAPQAQPAAAVEDSGDEEVVVQAVLNPDVAPLVPVQPEVHETDAGVTDAQDDVVVDGPAPTEAANAPEVEGDAVVVEHVDVPGTNDDTVDDDATSSQGAASDINADDADLSTENELTDQDQQDYEEQPQPVVVGNIDDHHDAVAVQVQAPKNKVANVNPVVKDRVRLDMDLVRRMNELYKKLNVQSQLNVVASNEEVKAAQVEQKAVVKNDSVAAKKISKDLTKKFVKSLREIEDRTDQKNHIKKFAEENRELALKIIKAGYKKMNMSTKKLNKLKDSKKIRKLLESVLLNKGENLKAVNKAVFGKKKVSSTLKKSDKLTLKA